MSESKEDVVLRGVSVFKSRLLLQLIRETRV